MKNTIFRLCFALSAVFILSACTARPQQPQTIEDYNLNQVFEQCKSNASDMNDGVKNSSNILWNSYFEMCMGTNGYTRADYKHFWY